MTPDVPRRWMGPITWLTLALVWCAALSGLSAAPAGESAEERIARLERRVTDLEEALRKALASGALDAEELRRQIDILSQELEKERIGRAAAPRKLEPSHGLGPAASKVYDVERGVSVGGYGEVLYQDFDATRDDGRRSGSQSVADALRAVLYFGYKFNDRIVFNSEIEFEHATTGEGDEELGEASVEFAYLDFLPHPAAGIRAGLLLVPVGFINELHEPPVFLGARRPDVENRILPTTWREVGAGVVGEAGPFSYRGYLMSGLDASGFSADSGLRDGRQSGAEASARDLAWAARVDFHGLPGLLVGASAYTGDSGQGANPADLDPNDPSLPDGVVKGTVTLYDLHAEYNARGLSVRGLWAAVDLDDAAGIGLLAGDTVGSRLRGWYGQVGYDLLAARGETTRQSIIPFVRYERYDTQDRVPPGGASSGQRDVRLITYGASYKPIDQVAIKLEFQDYTRGDGSGTDQINAALSYLF